MTRFLPSRWQRLLPVLFAAFLLLGSSGCAMVTVKQVKSSDSLVNKRADVLNTGKLSPAARETLSAAGLDESQCEKDFLVCRSTLLMTDDLNVEQRLSALSELWVKAALAMTPKKTAAGDQPMSDAALDAWLEAARYAYAYLFYSGRSPSDRAFEDRQTQVRDYYNYAAEKAAVVLFVRARAAALAGEDYTKPITVGSWSLASNYQQLNLKSIPAQLVPAGTVSFVGLRSTYRRDGFGAELVAVMNDPAGSTATPPSAATPAAQASTSAAQSWSEMPSPSMTVLLRFSGKNLWEVLHDDEPEVEIHDPYQVSEVTLHGQQVPLAANFTAGYALWLARSNFSRQSLRSLFGSKGGIDTPHLYMMQPYDPNRRVLLMIHGLASSPEAWVNVANELMRDDEIRQDFQVWQFYYPTNMPIAMSHDAMRHTLSEVLKHFDPSGKAQASHDMVLVGHSMGGVIARLMISSSGDHLVDTLLETAQMTPAQRELLRTKGAPVLTFLPEPEVSRVVFIATPHRGTDVAGTRLGRWIGRLVRLPLTVLEDVATIANDGQIDRNDGKHGYQMNSIQNLDKDDPFVRAVADLPMSPKVHYHSIIARAKADGPLEKTDDGLVPYWSSHLPHADSEKVIVSGHSVQEATPAIVELRRILHEDMQQHSATVK